MSNAERNNQSYNGQSASQITHSLKQTGGSMSSGIALQIQEARMNGYAVGVEEGFNNGIMQGRCEGMVQGITIGKNQGRIQGAVIGVAAGALGTVAATIVVNHVKKWIMSTIDESDFE